MLKGAKIRREGEIRRHKMADTVSQIKRGLKLIAERERNKAYSEKSADRQGGVNEKNTGNESVDILPFIRDIKEARKKIRSLEEHEQRLKRHAEEQNKILKIQKNSIKSLQENKARLKAAIEKLEQIVRQQRGIINQLLSERTHNSPKQSDPKGYYKILGLRPDAFEGLNEEQIQNLLKRHHRVYSHLHHTDKGGDLEKIKLLNEAYTFLINTKNRAEYKKEV
ncbi:J domain-containing protein [Patescibacteria group bacterium]|nr:J domain-containing protein [Patescibacteria group bacterium]